jgi:hypothetical protein
MVTHYKSYTEYHVIILVNICRMLDRIIPHVKGFYINIIQIVYDETGKFNWISFSNIQCKLYLRKLKKVPYDKHQIQEILIALFMKIKTCMLELWVAFQLFICSLKLSWFTYGKSLSLLCT